jgi:hypothetical protein
MRMRRLKSSKGIRIKKLNKENKNKGKRGK